MERIVLASGSPRRARILCAAGVTFDILRTDAAEVSLPADPARTVTVNAANKWRAGAAAAAAGTPVLAADTIVWFAGRIYGKPRDLDEAAQFLHTLSAQTHVVYTGVAFGRAGAAEPETAVAESAVTFNALTDDLIAAYVARVRPTDRAGAYDIAEDNGLVVASYAGEFENIMGLPLEPLRKWGLI